MADASLTGGAEAIATDRRMTARNLTSIQVMVAVVLTVGLIVTLNFSSRITLDRDLGQIHSKFANEIDALIAEQEKLLAELAYVKSDAYVEYWARDAGKMIREGEVLIMPQNTGVEPVIQRSAVRLVEFQTTAPEPENWELWWALFFDAPPPAVDPAF